jgi:hypothetical protein
MPAISLIFRKLKNCQSPARSYVVEGSRTNWRPACRQNAAVREEWANLSAIEPEADPGLQDRHTQLASGRLAGLV